MTSKTRYHFIYKTTCIINNKFYIGRHTTYNLDDGYMGSGKILKSSILKHGRHNFIREIIFFANSRDDLIDVEIELVNSEVLQEDLCMNITLGGYGDWYHQNSNSKIQKLKNKKSAIKQKFLIENDEDFKLNKQLNGSKIFKKLWAEGKTKPVDWTGKKHKPETILKLKNSKKGHGTGVTNSNYNKRWVCNYELNEIKKINIEELEKYLQNGWEKGKITPKKLLNREKKIDLTTILKNRILKSNIDVSVKGWPVLMANELGFTRAYLKKFIKKELPDFFSKCLIESQMCRNKSL